MLGIKTALTLGGVYVYPISFPFTDKFAMSAIMV